MDEEDDNLTFDYDGGSDKDETAINMETEDTLVENKGKNITLVSYGVLVPIHLSWFSHKRQWQSSDYPL